MPPSRPLLCTSLAALILLAQPMPARAGGDGDGQVNAYRGAVSRGSALFEDGEYARARAEFVAAYQIHPDAVLLFNIASTYRREKDLERAIAFYRKFLAEASAADPRRELAAQTLADLEEERRAPSAAPRTEPIVVPLEEPARPPAPTAVTPAAAVSAAAPPRRAPARTLHSSWFRWAGIGLAATSLVTAGAALFASRDASAAERELESLQPGMGWHIEQLEVYQRGEAAQDRFLVWTTATAVLAASGVVLYIVGERRRRSERAALTVAPIGDGVTMLLAGGW